MPTATPASGIVVVARCDRDALIAVLQAERLTCTVATDTPQGWVRVHVLPDDPWRDVMARIAATLETPVIARVIDDDDEYLDLLVWSGVGAPEHWSGDPARANPPAHGHQPASTASAISRAVVSAVAYDDTAEGHHDTAVGQRSDDADTVAGVSRLLERGNRNASDLWADVVGRLGLPAELAFEDFERRVVLFHGPLSTARLTAAMVGPAWIAPAGDGWHLLAGPGADSATAMDLATGLRSAVGSRQIDLLVSRLGECVAYTHHPSAGGPADRHLWNARWSPLPEGRRRHRDLDGPRSDPRILGAALVAAGVMANDEELHAHSASKEPLPSVALAMACDRVAEAVAHEGSADEILTALAEVLDVDPIVVDVLAGRVDPSQVRGALLVERRVGPATAPSAASTVRDSDDSAVGGLPAPGWLLGLGAALVAALVVALALFTR